MDMETQILIIKGVKSEMEPEDQLKIDKLMESVRQIMDKEPEEFIKLMAFTLLMPDFLAAADMLTEKAKART